MFGCNLNNSTVNQLILKIEKGQHSDVQMFKKEENRKGERIGAICTNCNVVKYGTCLYRDKGMCKTKGCPMTLDDPKAFFHHECEGEVKAGAGKKPEVPSDKEKCSTEAVVIPVVPGATGVDHIDAAAENKTRDIVYVKSATYKKVWAGKNQ